MVVPVLGCKNCRYAEAHNNSRYSRCAYAFLAQRECKEVVECQHAQANPYTECVERTRIYIVTLARLTGARVEIYHKRNTHHNEEPHHHREAALVAVELVNQAEQTEQEGQEEICIARRILGHLARQTTLRTEVKLVKGRNTREPITVSDSILVGLNIVLTSYKVPEEVAPIHIVELVGEEVVEILTERRLCEALARHVVVNRTAKVEHLATHSLSVLVAYNLAILVTQDIYLCAICRPRLIRRLALHRVPQAGEEVLELRRIYVVGKLQHLLVSARFAVVVVRCSLNNIIYGSRVVGTIQKRSVTILVTVQHSEQRVGVVGVVAVHRRVSHSSDCYRCV